MARRAFMFDFRNPRWPISRPHSAVVVYAIDEEGAETRDLQKAMKDIISRGAACCLLALCSVASLTSRHGGATSSSSSSYHTLRRREEGAAELEQEGANRTEIDSASGFVGVSKARERVAASCDEFQVRSAEWAPSNLHLNLTFYKKYVNVSGLAVVGSGVVTDEALLVAAKIVKIMSSRRPDLHRALIEDRVRVAIMAQSEQTTDIPEHRMYTDLNWARGLGATRWSLASSGAEENVLAWEHDHYRGDNIFVHELSHSYLGVNLDAPRYLYQMRSAVTLQHAAMHRYNASRARGLWNNTYSESNADEWFAVGAQIWFNAIRDGPEQGNGLHNSVNSRAELEAYDKGLYELLEAVFPAYAVIPNACKGYDDSKPGA